MGRVQADRAKVYAAPSDTSEVRYVLPRGSEVKIVGQVESFYTVQLTGWQESGFMKRSEVFQGLPAATASHQMKDPGTALVLSLLVTGGGHMYAGEIGVGAVLLGLGIAAPTLGYLATAESIDVDCSGYSCEDNTNWTPLYLGLGVGALAHLIGIVDSGRAVRAHNQHVALRPTYDGGPGLALRVGL